MSKQPSLNTYGRQILIWSVITAVIAIALNMGIDQKVVVFGTVVIGVFTQAFAGLVALIATIPLIGPFIIKVLAIPFFWILNALGYFVGAIAIKKGYRSEFTKSRILTLALLIGIIIGLSLIHI